jgi:cephalosporin-C deacetylase
MNLFDLKLEELQVYKPEQTKEKDFDAFWEGKIKEAKEQALEIRLEKKEYEVPGVEVYDVFFKGFKNSVIHGTYVKPQKMNGKAPAVAMFHGYNWNNLVPSHAFKYTVQGVPVLMVDVRGQNVLSPDHANYVNGGSAGWMTKGILDAHNYYYVNVYMDCYRAIEVLASFEEVDASRMVVEGGSQGGALTLATAALHPKVALAMADIPYLSHFRRSMELYNGSPYDEIYHYFKLFDPLHTQEEQIYRVLSYIDCMNLADRINCPTLISVGLEDTVCPPSTGFAVFNHMSCEKEIRVYPEYGHGGFTWHEEEKIKFFAKHLGGK